MGKRVHVCKKYDVEYGSTEGFNWGQEGFYALLQELGAEPLCDAPDGWAADDFECATEDYDDAIANLRTYIKAPETLENRELIASYLSALVMTAEDVLDIMESFKSEADTRDGYLHFSCF